VSWLTNGLFGLARRCGGMFSAVVMRTTNGGLAWSAQALPGGVGNLSAVAGRSGTQCTAVGSNGVHEVDVAVATSDGGASWDL